MLPITLMELKIIAFVNFNCVLPRRIVLKKAVRQVAVIDPAGLSNNQSSRGSFQTDGIEPERIIYVIEHDGIRGGIGQKHVV